MVASNLETLANMALEIVPPGGCVKPAQIYKVIKWPLRHGVTPPCDRIRGIGHRGHEYFIVAASASFSLEESVIYALWANRTHGISNGNVTTVMILIAIMVLVVVIVMIMILLAVIIMQLT